MSITFDTGALLALVDSRRLAMRKVYDTAITHGIVIRVPTIVVAEWWRAGRREKDRASWLRSMKVEALVEATARLAGVALGLVPGAQTADAIVMATAATCGDNVVYTSDPRDLTALRDGVPQFSRMHIEHA